MFGIAILLVIGSGFLHSLWNLFAKRSLDKNIFLWFCNLVGVIAFLPWVIMEWDAGRFAGMGLVFVIATTLLHGLYMNLVAATYSAGDLSQVYPIMRGVSPLLVPLIGVTLLDERLTVFGWLGVAAIVTGIWVLSNFKLKLKIGEPSSFKAPLLAFAVGLCVTGYIVTDKIGIGYVPPVVLNEFSHLGGVLGLSWAVFNAAGVRRELRVNWKYMLIGGVILPGGYLLFLLALKLAPVAQLAPMREIGIVFGTVMGILLLRERQGIRRILASIVITAGVVVIGIWG